MKKATKLATTIRQRCGRCKEEIQNCLSHYCSDLSQAEKSALAATREALLNEFVRVIAHAAVDQHIKECMAEDEELRKHDQTRLYVLQRNEFCKFEVSETPPDDTDSTCAADSGMLLMWSSPTSYSKDHAAEIKKLLLKSIPRMIRRGARGWFRISSDEAIAIAKLATSA